MWRVHNHVSSSEEAHLIPQLTKRPFAGLAVDLDRRQRDEVREPSEERSGYVHVAVERRGVGMDVHDGHLSAVLGEVDAVRDELGLVLLDEGGQLRDRRLQLREFSGAHLRRIDVYERLCHVHLQSSAICLSRGRAAGLPLGHDARAETGETLREFGEGWEPLTASMLP